MIAREIVVGHKLGLHARASARLVKLSAEFTSRINISRSDHTDGTNTDAGSILSILMLAAGHGTKVRVSAEGRDEQEAVDAVCQYLENADLSE